MPVVDMLRDEKRNNGKWKPMKENSDIFPTYVCWLASAFWSKVGVH